MAVGPCASSKRATADSGTAAPAAVATLSDSRICRSPRARSSSCTRIGTCRSPTSNLARLAPMSPMVAMRTASEMASVETPSSAAMSLIGTTRSSGRSSSAVETTLASSGMRLAWLVSSAAAWRDGGASRPETTSCSWRWPLSCRNQKRMSGTPARPRPISSLILAWLRLAALLGHQVDDERRLAHLRCRDAHHAAAVDEHALHLRARTDACARRHR